MINIFRLTHSMWPIHFRTAIENLLCSAVWNVECVCAEKDSAAGFCLCLTATSSRFLFWLLFLMCITWPPVWTDIIIGIAKKINENCYAERPRIIHLSCFTGKNSWLQFQYLIWNALLCGLSSEFWLPQWICVFTGLLCANPCRSFDAYPYSAC